MALSRQKKEETVSEIKKILSSTKITVIARFSGIPVSGMQTLRELAKESGTTVKVIKNRLFLRALAETEKLKDVDLKDLNGQLLYAFNNEDEAAPAQNLAEFAKNNFQVEFVGAITADGQLLTADDVRTIAALPSKDYLKSQLILSIGSPLSGFVNVVSGNLRSVLYVFAARAEKLSS